jgi:tetratricopeptide (TPR) repeat protein
MKRLLFLVLLFSGCIYYNTFYNAQKYFDEEDYDRSLEKCKKILEKYPKSKYVDDAVFLMGKNYYYLNNFDESKNSFRKIVDYFPNSPFRDESYLFLGKIALEKRDLNETVIFLERAAESSNSEIIMETFKTKLELYLLTEEPEKVIDEGQKFIEKYGSNLVEAYYLIGNANRLIGKNKEALEMYKNALKESKQSPSGRLIHNLAELYVSMDSLAKALSVIEEGRESDTLSLLKGKILMQLESLDEAIKSLESISKKRDSLGVVARYYIGEIKELQGDTSAALESYKKAESVGNFEGLSKKVQARKEILENISLLKTLAEKKKDEGEEEKEEETKKNQEKKDSSYIFFRIGEIYYWDLQEKEKGVEWYRKVHEQFPQSQCAPKAIFTLLNIELNEDSTSSPEARELFSVLEETYPNTKYSEKAKELYEPCFQDTTGKRE